MTCIFYPQKNIPAFKKEKYKNSKTNKENSFIELHSYAYCIGSISKGDL